MANDPKRNNPYTGTLTVKIVVDQKDVGILDSQDIVDCYFIEDIYSFCLTGKIAFYDVYGLFERGPLTGNEMISLTYGVEENREIVFHIWKVNTITQTSEVNSTAENLIEVFIVDSSFYNMMVTKFSRSFTAETKYTDVVKHLLENMVGWQKKDILIEESKNNLPDNWAIPYWNVAQSINWLLKRSIGIITGTSGYLCYNNTFRQWSANVRTLNWLFGEDNFIDSQDYIFEGNNPNTQNKIYEWWLSGIDKSSMKTVRGGKFRGFDSSQKKLIQKDWVYTSGVASSVLLGRKAILPDISDVNSIQKLMGDTTESELQSTLYDDWVKKYSIQNAFNVIVEGNERRFAGMQIQIRWPSMDQKHQRWQKQLEGKYLIKSITHNFIGRDRSNINYMQRMVLLKNAFQNSSSENLINATKINVKSLKKKSIVRDI